MIRSRENLKAFRLLFFEPYNEIGAAMTSMLRAEGFGSVTHVYTIENARAEISSDRCDAALLEADGYEMAVGQISHDVRLFKLGGDPFLPILVSQSDVTEESARLFSFAGVDALLDKPFSPVDVLRHLEDLANRPRLFVVNGPYAGPEHRGKRRPDDLSKHIEAFNSLRSLLMHDAASRDTDNETRAKWRRMLCSREAVTRTK